MILRTVVVNHLSCIGPTSKSQKTSMAFTSKQNVGVDENKAMKKRKEGCYPTSLKALSRGTHAHWLLPGTCQKSK